MKIKDYFLITEYQYKNIVVNKLPISKELHFIDLYKELVSKNESNSLSPEDFYNIISELSVIIQNYEDIKTNEELVLEVFREYVTHYIGLALKDKDIEGFFGYSDEEIDDKAEVYDYLEGANLLLWAILTLGRKAIDKFSISELYILKRYSDIENAGKRIQYTIDTAMASNVYKDSLTNHIKEIRHGANTAPESIYDNIKQAKIEEEQLKEYLETLTPEQREQRNLEEFRKLYGKDSNNKENGGEDDY